ncbi:MAG: 2-aminoethylphosphonate--pyruvate transaminase [Methanonatronarchaeales archaeon]|nr:2-aminoethylphosphonate--pyruvate transaminase [Methanonatronarchaeales archaeon]
MNLFIPGPVEVRPELLEQMSRPMIGHRTERFSELYESVVQGLQRLTHTGNRVFVSTSSSTGLMEGSVRNAGSPVLNLVNGAFGKRWHEITLKNGVDADALEFPVGEPVDPDTVQEMLGERSYSAVTMVHNESSTGVLNPLEVAEVVPDDTLFLLDTVSSMGGVDVDVDSLGVDVCLFGTQKCMGLPPGLSFASLSEDALDRSENVEPRGYYFSYGSFCRYDEKRQTISTPNIPLMYALDRQLEYIHDEEGMDARFRRHARMMDMTHSWARGNGFDIYPREGYESRTVTCIENTRGVNIDEAIVKLRDRGYLISNGYGELKGETFRVGHMGDRRPEELEELLGVMDEVFREAT